MGNLGKNCDLKEITNVILGKSGRIINIIFFIYVIGEQLTQPFPVQAGQHGHHQQGHDDAAVADDGPEVVNAETNGQQYGETKEEAEIDKVPGPLPFFVQENKDQEEQEQHIDLNGGCQGKDMPYIAGVRADGGQVNGLRGIGQETDGVRFQLLDGYT